MAQESWKLEQEEPPCSTPEAPSLCANNCGFFGSSATMNLCSSCYGNLISSSSTSEKKISSLDPPKPPSSLPSSSSTSFVVSSPSSSSPSSSAPSPGNYSLRCLSCNKKVGLRGFKCRCGDIFCSVHRYSDKHNCSFDYKASGRAVIAKENPIVKAEKLHKI